MSNEDEAEVEDELAALEAEMGGKEQAQTLPSVPNAKLPEAAQKNTEPAPVQEERVAIPA
jgi:charged multivesicular body protein 6